jgi:hypothetical protein
MPPAIRHGVASTSEKAWAGLCAPAFSLLSARECGEQQNVKRHAKQYRATERWCHRLLRSMS